MSRLSATPGTSSSDLRVTPGRGLEIPIIVTHSLALAGVSVLNYSSPTVLWGLVAGIVVNTLYQLVRLRRLQSCVLALGGKSPEIVYDCGSSFPAECRFVYVSRWLVVVRIVSSAPCGNSYLPLVRWGASPVAWRKLHLYIRDDGQSHPARQN